MTLSDYLEKKKVTAAEMAERVGVSREYISMLAAGKRTPSLEIAFKIERHSSGLVPVKTWGAAA